MVVLDCGLTEVLKWGVPCYTHEGKNIVLIHGFKHYCAMLFFKGALLKDPLGILIAQTDHVQAARQLRFTNVAEISRIETVIKDTIGEAIAVEQAVIALPFKETGEFAVAPEFQSKLDESAPLKAAFAALTPGRQRAYLLHFAGAKQSKTRAARVDKAMPHILAGKGLDDA